MDFYYVWTPWGNEPEEKYLWEIFPCTDGILISKGYITPKLEDSFARHGGISKFLRWQGPVMGDSGAWLYKNEEKPPYSVRELLDYYVHVGIPLGAHLDHSIFKTVKVDGVIRELTENEKKRRWQVTIDNARETMDLLQRGRYNGLEVIGVIQGWDVESYRRATTELLAMGYEYLAIGSIARKPTSQLLKIVDAVNAEIDKFPHGKREKTKIHLFGFARLELIPYLMTKRVISFDTAAPLRQAWESGEHNYHFASPWRSYTAIRIRLTRVRKNRRALRSFEKKTLSMVYQFAEHRVPFKRFLRKLLDYEKKILRSDGLKAKDVNKILPRLRERYVRTLEDRPWEKCSCPVCKERKVDVIVFREGWRNISRAYHNVRQFYLELNRIRNFNQSSKAIA